MAMHLFGMWGLSDTTIPPLSNTDDPTMSLSNDGWYYSTARNTTDRWADDLNCAGRVATADWGIDGWGALDATPGGAGCTARLGGTGGADVVECIFDGGHLCNTPALRGPMIAFISSHSRIGACPGSRRKLLFGHYPDPEGTAVDDDLC